MTYSFNSVREVSENPREAFFFNPANEIAQEFFTKRESRKQINKYVSVKNYR